MIRVEQPGSWHAFTGADKKANKKVMLRMEEGKVPRMRKYIILGRHLRFIILL